MTASVTIWLFALGSVFLVSLVSLVGIVALSFGMENVKKWLLLFVSFSAGTLLGDAFLHLLPQVTEQKGFSLSVSFGVLAGILVWFVIEKFIHWHHCHHEHEFDEDHVHPFAVLNLIGDFVHNIIDGMIIAASFVVSVPVGIATTVAVVLHEIPQELSDFGVLLHGGLSRGRALFLNFLSALGAVLGAIFALFVAGQIDGVVYLFLPFAAGSFIYIATADLIPELHKDSRVGESIKHLVSLLGGIVVMALMLFLE
ncbi:MAG: ZIP family metal transporter [Candidatus Magasanikbacteria bacterium CG10_big_fil_rev_8_21_14_0_10_42_10]|uniref:ZIP family metal transporter n=2 Tax=Candidatus Magasanikiibacteriota TaxID=1752731 RepID=A0A2H0TVK5_9BACT|nr:MAG: ZIP family metal transporter [Candidatus Magasanikbacteria bacterium CG10_big_fil_rev_8_21_14_0_10_42_10]PIZ93802.1 MAG: ZIP family metal transporter [Candidatus Magasanikbacteria bacterium CG_4_10_14_0_2_um_filter_41_10]